MSTSGSTNFSVTRDNLVQDILEELGVTPIGGTPTSSHVTSVVRRLNYLVKGWANYGAQIFTRRTSSFSLVSGTASYTIGESGGTVTAARPVKVLGAYLRNSAGEDIPIRKLTREEYEALPDKDDAGEPQMFFYDSQTPLSTLYLWPVTNASGYTLYLIEQRPIEDFDASTDNPDVPQSWYHAVFRVGVVECAGLFQKTPTQEQKDLAKEAFGRAIGANRELPQPLFRVTDGH